MFKNVYICFILSICFAIFWKSMLTSNYMPRIIKQNAIIWTNLPYSCFTLKHFAFRFGMWPVGFLVVYKNAMSDHPLKKGVLLTLVEGGIVSLVIAKPVNIWPNGINVVREPDKVTGWDSWRPSYTSVNRKVGLFKDKKSVCLHLMVSMYNAWRKCFI